jgi:hypothetical protein
MLLAQLLHHFLQALCANGDGGFTRTTLSSSDRTIKRLHRDPQHITVALPFTFYEIQVELRDAGTITLRAPNALAVAPCLIAAAQLRPHKSPYARGDPSIICSQPRDPQNRAPQPRDRQSRPQRKTAYTLDIWNAFQTSILFQACKRTYNSLPLFFVDYISL